MAGGTEQRLPPAFLHKQHRHPVVGAQLLDSFSFQRGAFAARAVPAAAAAAAAVGRRETRERGNGEAAAAKVQARLAEEEITDAGERAEDLLRCSI